MDDIVDAWFASHFSSSIISREAGIYSHVRGAVDDLKRQLKPKGASFRG